MYHKYFQRYEEKFLLSPAQKQKILKLARGKIVPDEYATSRMRNIYFDTADSSLIQRTLEKPVFKNKFRVRAYDDLAKCPEVFLEMKTKVCDISTKRRTKLSLSEYKKYLADGKINQDDYIWREIDYYFRTLKLQPMLYMAYERESFAGATEKDLRITFDMNLRSRTQNLDIACDKDTEPYFADGTCIMEVKSSSALPLWLARALSTMQVLPTSFSKYGRIFTKDYDTKLII